MRSNELHTADSQERLVDPHVAVLLSDTSSPEQRETAFSRLFTEHSPGLLAYAEAITGSAPEAEDVVQESFIKVWGQFNKNKYKNSGPLSAWLGRIVRNQSIDHRRKKRHDSGVEPLDYVFDTEAKESLFANPAHELEVKEKLEALNSIHCKRKQTLLLYGYGFTHKEIGDMLGISEGTVASRVNRARRELKAQDQMAA